MTEAEARARIENETAWDSAPALTPEQVTQLVADARATDVNGVAPGSVGYVDTWTAASVSASVAAGFRWKAAKVSGQFDVKAGDVEAKRSQQAAMLSRRASAAGGIGSITLTTGLV